MPSISESNGINLKGILNDIESLSQDIMNMQFSRKPSIEAKSLENVMSSSDPLSAEKPYKSEINLVLMNPGDDSPPIPSMPEPMAPIYPYQYGFERFDVPVQAVPYVPMPPPPQIPQLPLQIPLPETILPNVYTIPAVQIVPSTNGEHTSPPLVEMRQLSAEAKRNIFKNRSTDSATANSTEKVDEDLGELKHNSNGEVS